MKLLLVCAVALAACQSNTVKNNADETSAAPGSAYDSIAAGTEKQAGAGDRPAKQPDANTAKETATPADAGSPGNKNTIDENASPNTSPDKAPEETNPPANKNDQPPANGPERNYPDAKGSLDDTAAENSSSKNKGINPSLIKIQQKNYPGQKGNLDDTAAETKQFKKLTPLKKQLARQ